MDLFEHAPAFHGGPLRRVNRESAGQHARSVWDKGPVRHGSVAKAEGGQVPRIHDSEVAAIGHALQEILIRRGFLDAMGAQMPTGALACTNDAGNPASPAPVHVAAVPAPRSGKQCPECGAHALRKVDGCLRCEHCHHIGSCG